jgi:hypothetical protein
LYVATTFSQYVDYFVSAHGRIPLVVVWVKNHNRGSLLALDRLSQQANFQVVGSVSDSRCPLSAPGYLRGEPHPCAWVTEGV